MKFFNQNCVFFIKRTLVVALSFLLSSCGPEVSFEISASKLFSNSNEFANAYFLLTDNSDCKTTNAKGTEEFEVENKDLKKHAAEIFHQSSRPKFTRCRKKGGEIDLHSITVSAEITSFNSDADFVIFRQKFPDISVGDKLYEIYAIKPSLNRQFLERLTNYDFNERVFKPADNKFTDVSTSVIFHNDDSRDVIITGYNLWINGEPKDVFYRKKIAPLEKLKVELSKAPGEMIAKGLAPIAFFVGREKQR